MKCAARQRGTGKPRAANSAGVGGQRLREATVPSQQGGTAAGNARPPPMLRPGLDRSVLLPWLLAAGRREQRSTQ